MLNDRDGEHPEPEEMEYHFSDDESVSYEVETESKKPEVVPSAPKNLLNQLTRSKRMMISLGVFLILVFVAYKMVAPNSSTPSTMITAPVITADQKIMPKAPLPTTSDNNTAMSPQSMPTMQQAALPQPPMMTAPMQPPAMTQPSMNAAPAMSPSTIQQQPMMAAPSVQNQQAMTTGMPAVIPVQPPVSSYNMNPSAAMNGVVNNVAGLVDPRVLNQLQADYEQKLNDFAAQNKILQDQLQALNARVASVETQMNQLVQVLTRQNQAANQTPVRNNDAASQTADAKIAYTVQAIIPGRAWLRSDGGETVTVAEGDAIKDLGRVTKIDPYNGTVEINTGNRVVSLSYGSSD